MNTSTLFLPALPSQIIPFSQRTRSGTCITAITLIQKSPIPCFAWHRVQCATSAMHDRDFERSSQTFTCPATAEFSYTVQDIHLRCDQASHPLSNEQPRNEECHTYMSVKRHSTLLKKAGGVYLALSSASVHHVVFSDSINLTTKGPSLSVRCSGAVHWRLVITREGNSRCKCWIREHKAAVSTLLRS